MNDIARWPIFDLNIDNTFFTADLHFGHKNIIEYCERPYDSVDEMNTALIDNWNAVVKPDNEVWVLGDVALGRIHESLANVSKLNGHKYLVVGNHDRCWQGLRRYGRWVNIYERAGFEIILDRVQFDVGYPVGACHFPGPDENDSRFNEYRPDIRRGEYLIHGHCHTTWHTYGSQYNVGVDVNNYMPVKAQTVLDYFKGLQ